MKKIIEWLKIYWKIPAVILAIIFLAIIGGTILKGDSMKKIREMLKEAENSYDEQIKIINHENKKKEVADKKAREDYLKIQTDLDKQYSKKRKEMSKKERKDLEKMVKKYQNDPGALTREIAEKYGIQYIEGK